MALNWYWDKKVGEATFRNRDGKLYKTSLYKGNAFLISLYLYTDENGEKMYSMHGFFCDEAHAKRCLGLAQNIDKKRENLYKDNLVGLTFYRDMLDPKHLGKLLTLFGTADFDAIKIEVKASAKRTRKGVQG